jgi:hypothetical protein
MSKDDNPWVPCQKPCRFLKERFFDSPEAGVLAGVEQRCINPVYDHLGHLQQLLASAQAILTTERAVLDGVSHENSYRLSRERIHNLDNIIGQMWSMCTNIAATRPPVSRDHHYTKEKEDDGGRPY